MDLPLFPLILVTFSVISSVGYIFGVGFDILLVAAARFGWRVLGWAAAFSVLQEIRHGACELPVPSCCAVGRACCGWCVVGLVYAT